MQKSSAATEPVPIHVPIRVSTSAWSRAGIVAPCICQPALCMAIRRLATRMCSAPRLPVSRRRCVATCCRLEIASALAPQRSGSSKPRRDRVCSREGSTEPAKLVTRARVPGPAPAMESMGSAAQYSYSRVRSYIGRAQRRPIAESRFWGMRGMRTPVRSPIASVTAEPPRMLRKVVLERSAQSVQGER
jgi:hypothetical protein